MFLKNNCLSILWGLLIILLTTLPGNVFPKLPSYLDLFQPDKLVHLFIFLVFVFLMIRGFYRAGTPPVIRRNAITVALTLAITIGGLTEVIQGYFIPMRVGSPYDFIANTVGSALGACLALIILRRNENG